MKRFGIPLSCLTKLSTYNNISINGLVEVKVLVANCEYVIEKQINDFIDIVRRAEIKVVGVDLKQITSQGKTIKLVAMFSGSFSVFFNVDHSQVIPKSLFTQFVEDDNICFIAATDAVKNLILTHHYFINYQKYGDSFGIPCVLVGDLAVMALKKEGLNKLNVAEIAGLIGVVYDKKVVWNSEGESSIQLDMVDPLVFTTGKIEYVISDACACYQIGYKFLSSL